MNRKINIILYSILTMSMLYNCLMAQQNKNIRSFITVDTIIAMPQLQFPNALASCQWKDTLLFVDYHVALHTDSFYVYELGICSHTIDSFCIYIPHLKRKMENENHSSFQYMDRLQNRLILGFSNLLYVLDKCNGKYTLSKRILLPKAVRFAKLWNKKEILLWDVYYGHHPDSWMANYDLETQKYVVEKEPYFFHPLLQYERPYHLVDMYNQNIIFAHRGKYASVIYNASLDSIQYFFMNSGDWNALSSKHISEIKKNFRPQQARSIMDAEDKWLHKIHQQLACYWIDSTHIICFTQQPCKKNDIPDIYVDVWELLNEKWNLKIHNLQDDILITCDSSNRINEKSFGIGFLANQSIHFFPKHITCLKSLGTSIDPIGLDKATYYQHLNTYYSENNSIVQIYIFSHTFNDKLAK